MSPSRWDEINSLFNALVELEPAERELALQRIRATDPELCAHVGLLLQQSAGSFQFEPRSESAEVVFEPKERLLDGRYRLDRKVGQGGFGAVYLAHDERLHDKPVVVKLLTRAPREAWSEKKFRDEIKALARINHPGVIGILDVGYTNSTPFIVLQYVDGVTLRQAIADGALDRIKAADIMRQIGHALAAAHEQGVVHRDVKPENIMLQATASGWMVRLIDFGIATIREHDTDTSLTRVAGSAAYMAPEQLIGRPMFTSDIFAMGVIAYEMLTGELPVRDTGALHMESLKTLSPSLPESSILAIRKAVAEDPEARYQGAATCGDKLARAIEGVMPEPAPDVEDTSESLPAHDIEYDIFIGHSMIDLDFACRVACCLARNGARCFVPFRDAQSGGVFARTTNQVIKRSRCYLLIVTDSANASAAVARQAEFAALQSVPVIALRVDVAEPGDPLSLSLDFAYWVEVRRSATASELDRALRAVRLKLGGYRGPADMPTAQLKLAEDPAQPVLSEFLPSFPPGRPGTRQLTVVAFFFGWALLTCLLSLLGSAGYITVMLQGPEGGRPAPVRFGYLYELNAAFTYLFFVPWFISFAVGFVRQAQAAILKLATREQLIVNHDKAGRPVVAVVAAMNRRWLNRWLFRATVIVSALLIVGTEYLPPKSDYKRLMFGYVQAPWVAGYHLQCPDCTLGQIEQASKRSLEPLSGFTVDELRRYHIVAPFYSRRGTALERIGFILFMVSALGLQVSVGVLVVWTIFKALFFLRLLYRAMLPSADSPVELLLLYTDPVGLFGLEPVHRALAQLVGLIGVSAVLQVLSWWSNAQKGSRHALLRNLDTLGGWGQFLVTHYWLILAVMLLGYLFSMGVLSRESANDKAERISRAPARNSVATRAMMDRVLTLIDRQSIWRSLRYTVTFLAAPAIYLASVLILNRADIAYKFGELWNALLSNLLGRD